MKYQHAWCTCCCLRHLKYLLRQQQFYNSGEIWFTASIKVLQCVSWAHDEIRSWQVLRWLGPAPVEIQTLATNIVRTNWVISDIWCYERGIDWGYKSVKQEQKLSIKCCSRMSLIKNCANSTLLPQVSWVRYRQMAEITLVWQLFTLARD